MITDPAGDSFSPLVDMVSGSATVDNGNLVLTVSFAPGFDSTQASITANLDIDQDPSTGYPGIDTANNDSAIMGTDYVVLFGASPIFGYYGIYEYQAGSFLFNPSGVSTTVLSDGMTATVPLSLLGNDDGYMNYKFLSQVVLSYYSTTTILDYMTDVGLAPGTSTVPEPSTLFLLSAGLVGVGLVRRRFKK